MQADRECETRSGATIAKSEIPSDCCRIVCAWCGKVMRDGDGPAASHGMCDDCVEILDRR